MGNANSTQQHQIQSTNGHVSSIDGTGIVEEKKTDDQYEQVKVLSIGDGVPSSPDVVPADTNDDAASWMVGDENGNGTNQSDRLAGIKQSYRSFKSSEGSIVTSSTPVASSVHTNLMRSYHHRDPMKHYTVCAILGQGSMGSVAKVHKKGYVKGGSARAKYVKENHGPCYQFCNTFIPPILAKFRKSDAFVLDESNKLLLKTPKTKNGGSNHDDDDGHHVRNNSSWLLSSRNWTVGEHDGSEQITSSSEKGTSHNKFVSFDNPPVPSSTPYQSESSTTISTTAGTNDSPTKSTPTSTKGNRKVLHHQHSSLITYGTRKETYYALKSIHLDRCSSKEFIEELKNEVEVLKSLDHANIVRAIETFDYHGRLFLVLELCQGGDLYTRDPYNEADARNIVNCILSAVAYMHSKGIVHRDLKFENICFADTTPTSEVRIIDFGLSQKFAANEHLHDAVGTVYTMAPELLKGEYDAKVDVWSIGVIAYSLLSSSLPFFGPDRLTVMKKIVRGRYRFTSRRWKEVSDGGKNFIHSLLQQDPELRPSAVNALDLTWLRSTNDTAKPYTDEELEQFDCIQSSIQAFTGYRTLKKLALMIVAYQSTSEEVGFVRRLFNRFDRVHDGEITLLEFRQALCEHYEYTEDEIEAMFHGIDIDGTGKVHYIEFLAATIESIGQLDEERLAEAFSRIDSDASGYITVSDLKEFLGKDIPDSYIERVICEADILHDHRVSYAEFLELWDFEADKILNQTKVDVRKRRRRHDSSSLQSTTHSSFSDNDGESRSIGTIDSNIDLIHQRVEEGSDHMADNGNNSTINANIETKTESDHGTGEFYYSQRKFQSMRKVDLALNEIKVANQELLSF